MILLTDVETHFSNLIHVKLKTWSLILEGSQSQKLWSSRIKILNIELVIIYKYRGKVIDHKLSFEALAHLCTLLIYSFLLYALY